MATREQFSVSMLPEVKTKLEKLAALRQITLSQLLELIAQKEVDSIDAATWDAIGKLQTKVGGRVPQTTPGSARPRRKQN